MVAEKSAKLEAMLRDMCGVLVALSGGVDSTLLLAVAAKALGPKVLAVTAGSSTFPQREVEFARELAGKLGVRHKVVISEELEIEGFAQNPVDRCYHCKKELYAKLLALAKEEGIPWIAEGSNADDLGDYRPGRKAIAELGIRSPLLEAGLTKAEVRELAKAYNLPNWDRPSLACLASRVPYGTPITRERLSAIDGLEELIRKLGVREVRVRHHGDIARIEVGAGDIARVAEAFRDEIVRAAKDAGYVYATLDLVGYRTGAMNEVLDQSIKSRL